MTVNKTTSDCTIYAFVGTAILAISLVVAMYFEFFNFVYL